MKLSWFFVASIAFHSAVALVSYAPPAVRREEITEVRFYTEKSDTAPDQALTESGGRRIGAPVKRRQGARAPRPPHPAASISNSDAAGVPYSIVEHLSQTAPHAEQHGDNSAPAAPLPQQLPLAAPLPSGPEAATATDVTAGGSANTPGETRAATEPFARAAYAFHPKPDYPERAKREGWEGTVLLEVLINSQGDPERVAVARSSGFALLDNAAREAVKGWRFRPASMGERRIASVERVPVVFRLETGN